MRSVFTMLFVLVIAVSASGCANIKSQSVNVDSAGYDGLIYHLPLKKIRMSVIVTDNPVDKGKTKIYTPSVEAGDAYPDMSSSFLLTISRSELGSNSLDISISTSGLLSVSKSTSVSAVDDVAKSIAASAAARAYGLTLTTGNLVNPPAPSQKCPDTGIYSRLVDYDEIKNPREGTDVNICGFYFSTPGDYQGLVKSEVEDVAGNPSKGKDKRFGPTYSGIYYRQAIPVQVDAREGVSGDVMKSFMVFIPDKNSMNRLPVPRNLFADNSTSITLSDGMPTGYSPQKNSEVLGLFKIPADVIGAYFEAFGKIFTAFGDAKKSEAAAASNAAYLQLQQSKMQHCLKAIASNDSDGIKSTCPTSAE